MAAIGRTVQRSTERKLQDRQLGQPLRGVEQLGKGGYGRNDSELTATYLRIP